MLRSSIQRSLPLILLVLGLSWGLWQSPKGLFDQLLESLKQVPLHLWVGAFALSFAQVLFQAFRFWFSIPQIFRPRFFSTFRIFAQGQLINLGLPGRSGDFSKALALSGEAGHPVSVYLGSVFLADKLLDVFSLMLGVFLFSPQVLMRFGFHSWGLPQWAGVFAVTFAVFILFWIKFRQAVVSFFSGLSVLRSPKAALLTILASSAAWWVEAWAIQTLGRAVGFTLPLTLCLCILPILNLGIAVPVTLANIGVYEASFIAAFLAVFQESQFPMAGVLLLATLHHFNEVSSLLLWNGVHLLGLKFTQRTLPERVTS
jgi:uncharacterized membrane protein YbhN (UPF0104 family)